jgi:hypothetical protein
MKSVCSTLGFIYTKNSENLPRNELGNTSLGNNEPECITAWPKLAESLDNTRKYTEKVESSTESWAAAV